MAKQAAAAPASEQTELARKGTTALAVGYDYGDQAGIGFDNQTSDDMSIPFLGVLQAISPEVAGEPGQRIKGATSGMMINTVTKELYDGDAGVIVQPCDTSHVYVEWKPRNQGGGFVGQHATDSDIVKKAIAESKEYGKYKTPTGNDLIETFYIAALMHRSADVSEQATLGPEPILIAFTSTKIRAYKNIMTRLRTFAGRPPLFAHRLRFTTVTEKNNKGVFSNYAIAPLVDGDVAKSLIPPRLGDGPNPLLVAGQELLKSYRGGLLKVNHDSAKDASGAENKADIPF